jgi:hypothetical protein
MSWFDHVICMKCWEKREGYGLRDPIRVLCDRQEVCCFCGDPTTDRIYVRVDPSLVKCKGLHAEV